MFINLAKQKQKEEREQLENGSVPVVGNGNIMDTKSTGNEKIQSVANQETDKASSDQPEVIFSDQSNAASKRPRSGEVRIIRVPGMTWHQAGEKAISKINL